MPRAAPRESARRVSDCVSALLRDQPFFGSLALRLPIRADTTRATLATDGHEIRYSPAWVAETEADLIKTAIARVVLACALKHHTRRDGRDPERWQLASQLVTHGMVRDAGFRLHPEAQAWDGMSIEEAYERLPEPDAGEGSPGTPPPPGAQNQAPPGAPPPPGDDDPGDDASKPNDANASGQPRPDDSDAQDDGGQDSQDGAQPPRTDDIGEAQSDPSASSDPAGTGEVMDAAFPAQDGAEAGTVPPHGNEQEQAWDEAMHQALNFAKAQGNVPGAVQETIEDAHRSILDWRSLLRRYMTDAAARDYSWSVPNRRFIDSGLYLPSIRSEGVSALAVIVDTSGSVDTDTLAAFWSEVREVAAEIDPERVVVLQVDAVVQDEQEYDAFDLPERIAVKGRMGTDFRPGFERLAEQGIEPAVCLYFTDMDCDRYPEHEPCYPVVWCDWGDGTGLAADPPPWGEHITIAD